MGCVFLSDHLQLFSAFLTFFLTTRLRSYGEIYGENPAPPEAQIDLPVHDLFSPFLSAAQAPLLNYWGLICGPGSWTQEAVRNVTEVSLESSGAAKVTSSSPMVESGGTHIQPAIILGKNILPTFQNTT